MDTFLDRLRMWPWLLVTIGLIVFIAWWSPANLEVGAWKAMLLTAAAWLGYWLDRATSPYARPHDLFAKVPHCPTDELRIAWLQTASSAMLRRAIIMAAVIVGAALAV